MSKTKSVVLFTIIIAVMLFLTVFAVIPEFHIGRNIYQSPITVLPKGQDIYKGLYTDFKITRPGGMTDEAFNESKDKTISILRKRLGDYNLSDAIILSNDDVYAIRLPTSLNAKMATGVFAQRGLFAISTTDNLNDPSKIIISNAHLSSIDTGFSQQANKFYISLNLTKAGKAAVESATMFASSSNKINLTLFLDGEKLYSVPVEAPMSYDVLTIPSDNEENTKLIKAVLSYGILPISLTVEEGTFIAPAFDTDVVMWLMISLVVFIVAIFVSLSIVYGVVGLASALSLVVSLLATLALLTFAYTPEFTISGIFAVVFGIALFTVCSVNFLQKTKSIALTIDEPNMQKRMFIATGRARKLTDMTTVKICSLCVLSAVVLAFFGYGTFRIFGVVLAYMSLATLLCNLFVTRPLAYLLINITNCRKCLALPKSEEVK
ncbi:MAG: hypothetical protein RR248_02995 [Clostridia bacterium]